MARIRSESKAATGIFSALQEASSAFGEKNDCTVKAIAIATGRTYQEAHAALDKHGRKKGRGCCDPTIKAAIESLGFKAEVVRHTTLIEEYPGVHKNLMNVTTHHPERFKEAWERFWGEQHNLLLFTRGHVSACIDGVVHDWANGRSKRISYVWKITKEEDK